MKYKVFRTFSESLEEQVNEWLKKGKFEITHVTQTSRESIIVLTIFYLDEKALRTKKLNKLNDYGTED